MLKPSNGAGQSRIRKPPDLIYGVDERPPLAANVLLGLQHVLVMTSGWVMVVVTLAAIGASREQTADVLRMSMIASGVATMLQSLRGTPVGSGYLCPIASGPAYTSATILAGRRGGLPLVFLMTVLSGVFEGLLARTLPRLRALFPPEVTGLVVMMVGIELVVLGCRRFLGLQEGATAPDPRSTLVATIALGAMIAPTIWARGRWRLYPVLIGLTVGFVAAYSAGLFGADGLTTVLDAPLVGLPRRALPGLHFDAAVLPAFLIASLASTLKAVGDLTLCQKINDAGWKRTDMKSVSGGVFAGAVGTGLSGLLGGIGQSTFSSNVGLSLATGATSRFIAIPCGILMVTLAFLPRLAALVAAMPDALLGATLVYVACYMTVGGIQVITSRMLDARRTFVVGIPLIFGLSVDMLPGAYAGLPAPITLLFSSSLSAATILVVLLNLILRAGITRRQSLRLAPTVEATAAVTDFLESRGRAWGARPEVIHHASAAASELLETLSGEGLASAAIDITVSFDEFNLDVEVSYEGRPLLFPAVRPGEAELLEGGPGLAAFSGFLVRQYADRLTSKAVNGRCQVHMHFDH